MARVQATGAIWKPAAAIAAALCGITAGTIVLLPFARHSNEKNADVEVSTPASTLAPHHRSSVVSPGVEDLPGSEGESPPMAARGPESSPPDRVDAALKRGTRDTEEEEEARELARAREAAAEKIRALVSLHHGSDEDIGEQGVHFRRIAIAFSMGLAGREPWRDPAYETFILSGIWYTHDGTPDAHAAGWLEFLDEIGAGPLPEETREWFGRTVNKHARELNEQYDRIDEVLGLKSGDVPLESDLYDEAWQQRIQTTTELYYRFFTELETNLPENSYAKLTELMALLRLPTRP